MSRIKPASRLEAVGEYYFSAKMREIEALNREGKNVINLGIGSPDMPPHPSVIETLTTEAAKPGTHAYQSYKGAVALRTAISSFYKKWYDVTLDPATEILPLIGSKEGIMHICMTYLETGDLALVPDPGYPTYSSAVKLAGAGILHYQLDKASGHIPNLEVLASMDLSKVRLMFLNYPHMPTGVVAEPTALKKLIDFAIQHQIILVHDNPYSFILNKNPLSMLSIPGAKEVVIELNSLSKSHNMAGWRVGMICADAGRIDEILRFKSNMDSGMFLPIQLAAATALELGDEWFDELNSVYKSRREAVKDLLKLIGAEANQDQSGLFIWASVSELYNDGFAMSDAILSQASVFITPGGIFGDSGKNHIRVSLCATEEKIREALARIKESGIKQ